MAVPLLLSGPAAHASRAELAACGFTNKRVVGNEVGKASAIKMIRSVMVKGIEALTDELMAAAHAAGVVDEVIASLDASERHDSWTVRASSNLERLRTHGDRKSTRLNSSH